MTITLDFIQAASIDGLIIDQLTYNQLIRVKVTGDRGGKRSGAYCLYDDQYPVGLWWNWKTGNKGLWTAVKPTTIEERRKQQAYIQQADNARQKDLIKQRHFNLKRNNALLAESSPIQTGDPVATYLIKRGISLTTISSLTHVRHHPKLAYYEDQTCLGYFPAMLGLITNHQGEVICLHRTYLYTNGYKADVPSPKKLTRASDSLKGASIRLGEPKKQSKGGFMLGVAEGIETALASYEYFQVPTWAAISANGMKSFTWSDNIQYLYVFGDHDANNTGQDAANFLAKKAAQSGLIAKTLIPELPGKDWADVWQSYKGANHGE